MKWEWTGYDSLVAYAETSRIWSVMKYPVGVYVLEKHQKENDSLSYTVYSDPDIFRLIRLAEDFEKCFMHTPSL